MDAPTSGRRPLGSMTSGTSYIQPCLTSSWGLRMLRKFLLFCICCFYAGEATLLAQGSQGTTHLLKVQLHIDDCEHIKNVALVIQDSDRAMISNSKKVDDCTWQF